jgi:thiamine biosynthesis lipoprotein
MPRQLAPEMTAAATSWSLWSTQATLVVTDGDTLGRASALARQYLDAVERAASRFRADSEVVRLAAAGERTTRVSEVLADLLREALSAARRSDGLVDPTVGTAMRRIGYDRDIELVMRDGVPVSAVLRPVPGWRQVDLRGDQLSLPAGVELDLGATAKAVAADRCAALVHEQLGTGVLVSLGGDIATAGPTPTAGWRVLVQDRPEDRSTLVTLGPDDAVATSSTASRTWSRGGRHHHHVVDPRTGLSAETPWRSVTVAAGSCVAANTASTAGLVKGTEAVVWLTGLGLPARLVGRDGDVVTLNAWPPEEAA